VNDLAWTPNGRFVLCASAASSLDLLRYSKETGSFKPAQQLQGHTGPVLTVGIDPTARRIAAGSDDALATLWCTQQLVCTQTLYKQRGPVRSVSFSAGGRYLAMATERRQRDPNAAVVADSTTPVHIAAVDYYTAAAAAADDSCSSSDSASSSVHELHGLCAYAVAWHPTALLLAVAVDSSDYKDMRSPAEPAFLKLVRLRES
jgi:WD40 repeat protein